MAILALHGDIAVLIWTSFGGLWGLWSGCGRCLCGCAFSWQFQLHYRRPYLTSVAGDIAVLVLTSFGGLRGIWSGCGMSLWFQWHHRRVSRTPAAEDIVVFSRRRPCSCHAVRYFAERTELCRYNRLSPVPTNTVITFFLVFIDSGQK